MGVHHQSQRSGWSGQMRGDAPLLKLARSGSSKAWWECAELSQMTRYQTASELLNDFLARSAYARHYDECWRSLAQHSPCDCCDLRLAAEAMLLSGAEQWVRDLRQASLPMLEVQSELQACGRSVSAAARNHRGGTAMRQCLCATTAHRRDLSSTTTGIYHSSSARWRTSANRYNGSLLRFVSNGVVAKTRRSATDDEPITVTDRLFLASSAVAGDLVVIDNNAGRASASRGGLRSVSSGLHSRRLGATSAKCIGEGAARRSPNLVSNGALLDADHARAVGNGELGAV